MNNSLYTRRLDSLKERLHDGSITIKSYINEKRAILKDRLNENSLERLQSLEEEFSENEKSSVRSLL